MRKIDKIIIHCSATLEGKDFNAKDIDAWHKDRGFNKIGYHYVIKLDGTVERGRPVEEIGSHCQGYNKNSIGICYIGGLDKNNKPKDTRTKEQKTTLIILIMELRKKYGFNIRVHGHNEFSNKACPCFDVKKNY